MPPMCALFGGKKRNKKTDDDAPPGPQKVRHSLTTADPPPPQIENEQDTIPFSQCLLLRPIANTWYIANDILTMSC
jgi:hypothetical protein